VRPAPSHPPRYATARAPVWLTLPSVTWIMIGKIRR